MLHSERSVFFFNDTATTEIYTLSLHDALPICRRDLPAGDVPEGRESAPELEDDDAWVEAQALIDTVEDHRSEEHTSELQSRQYLVCRLLLEKKNATSLAMV